MLQYARSLEIEPGVIDGIIRLSGGHPHLLQLLGSHLIEHENENPDGKLDSADLTQVLRTICYEDRARVYDSILHMLEVAGKLGSLQELLMIVSRNFPTVINRKEARKRVKPEELDWMVTHDILDPVEDGTYRLADEFLRIRLLLDAIATEERDPGMREFAEREFESRLLEQSRYFTQQDEWEEGPDVDS